MIYVQTNNQANIQAVEFDVNREKVTGDPFWITRGDRQIVRPELSADGKQFVMRVPRRTQDDIVVLSRDGRLLYYTLFSSESDIWLVELN
ncbi:MAG TPA: hypothetical protein VGN90_06205 [Pyrinomonadaceae bacterium]|jgi:hypothetical protein|nr:hypothetical protein [Pyrinomonadaceae bacterium]